MKIKNITIFAIVIMILVIVGTTAVHILSREAPKTLHEDMYDIFDEKNISIKLGDYREKERKTSVKGLEIFPDFKYDDTIYSCSYYILEESIVDKTKSVGQVPLYGDEAITMCAYQVKDVSPEYMLAVEIEDIYYPFVNWKCNHSSLNEFIDLIGPMDNLEIAYVKVEIVENEKVKKQYVYDEAEEWAWDFLMKNAHTFIDKVSGIKNVQDYVYPEKWVNLIVCIEHKLTKAEYVMELRANGNMSILDKVSPSHDCYEYEFSHSEITEAVLDLVRNYKAYSTE